MKPYPNLDFDKLRQGRYEAESLPKDFSPERAMPDYAFNLLNSLGYLYQPFSDTYRLEHGAAKPVWPDGKKFAVCLTHDVDAVGVDILQESLRGMHDQYTGGGISMRKLRVMSRMGLHGALEAFKVSRASADLGFDRWLELEKSFGAHSTFFFWPGRKSVSKPHSSDCIYDLTAQVFFDQQRCSVTEMIQEIDRRGYEIGLHPSWYAYNNLSVMKEQKDALEQVVGHDIVSVRQHSLHYDIRETPRLHVEAGFRYDSTLGFNDSIGFRFGTSYPWNLYDLKEEKDLPILEIPLIAQDGALLNPNKGMRLDEDHAFNYITQIAEAVENVGGIFTLGWHANWLFRKAWWGLYERTLQYLYRKKPWFATIQEAGQWWQSHH